MKITFITALVLAPLAALHAADSTQLEPIFSKRGDVIFSYVFDGPLIGQPANAEDQAKARNFPSQHIT